MRSLRGGVRLLSKLLRVPSKFEHQSFSAAEVLGGQFSSRQLSWELQKNVLLKENWSNRQFTQVLVSWKRTGQHCNQNEVQGGPGDSIPKVKESFHSGLLPALLLPREQQPLTDQFLSSARFSSTPGSHLAKSSEGSADGEAGDDAGFVPSPLMQAPVPRGASLPVPPGTTSPSKATPAAERIARAEVCRIAMSPKKLNLVAALVRRMTVKDALLQLKVSPKRAAKTVAKAIMSARANGAHNHGLDGTKLFVDECFVGKAKGLKRLFPRAKGKADTRMRPRCHLTVILKEIPPEREEARARLASIRSSQARRRLSLKLAPHTLVKTQWRWNREPGEAGASESVASQTG